MSTVIEKEENIGNTFIVERGGLKIPENPYLCDRPLRHRWEVETFIDGDIRPGFAELRDDLCRDIETNSEGFYAIRSTVREGVSTLFLNLERNLSLTTDQEVIPVYIDCFALRAEPKGTLTKERMFGFLANIIRYEAQDHDAQFNIPSKGEMTAQEFEDFVNNTTSTDKKAVLMLDEITILQEGSPPDFPELAEVYQTLAELAVQPREKGGFFVLIESRAGFDGWNDVSLARLQEFAPRMQILRLPLYTIDDINRLAALVPQIQYEPEGYRRIWELSGGNPALTQTILYYITKERQFGKGFLPPDAFVNEEVVDIIVQKRLCIPDNAQYLHFSSLSLTEEQLNLVRRLVSEGRIDRSTFAITGKEFGPQDQALLTQMAESRMIREDEDGNQFFAQGIFLWALPIINSL